MKKLLLLACACACVCGCTHYKGGKITEGTDLSVGMNIPSTEGALQFDFLNYLSGFRLAVADNAGLKMKYTCDEETSYAGVVTNTKHKTIEAEIDPKQAEQAKEQAK